MSVHDSTTPVSSQLEPRSGAATPARSGTMSQGQVYRGAAEIRHPAPGHGVPNGADCILVRPGHSHAGKQGVSYGTGISGETAGATGICLHLATAPPGGRAHAHLHAGHETAIYVLSGVAEMLYGPRLERRMRAEAGDFVYIPAGMPHLPWNPSADEPMVCLVARTDPNEQESVELLPHLEPRAAG